MVERVEIEIRHSENLQYKYLSRIARILRQVVAIMLGVEERQVKVLSYPSDCKFDVQLAVTGQNERLADLQLILEAWFSIVPQATVKIETKK